MSKSGLKATLRATGIKQIGDEAMGITEYRLQNGLKVLLSPNSSAPVVTYMQLFRVGSRDEGVGHTGATHFLEHMMFKGTRKFDPDKGLDSTELLNRIGAISNATTSEDRTNYFEVVPAEYLEFCIKLEADRMRNLRLRPQDREAEMSVVRNELERGENSPEEALDKEMYAIAFREHPYHHPTIGWRSDVEGVPMERLKKFYDDFYWPDNCTVILTGDFETETALTLIQKYYGKIPASPHKIPLVYTVEPPQEGERRYEIRRNGDLTRVWIGFHVPSSSHPDHHAINIVSHLLGSSADRSSRLYTGLVDTGLAVDIMARHDERRDPGLLVIGAYVTPDISPIDVENAIYAEIAKLAAVAVRDEELAPLRAANRKGSVLARADQMEFAFHIGEAEARADWRWLIDFDDKYESVTPEDILRVARTYFDRSNRTVGYFIPEVSQARDEQFEDEEDEAPSEKSKKKRVPAARNATAAEVERILAPSIPAEKQGLAARVVRHKLNNGLTILYMPNPGTESVAVWGQFPAGTYYEPGNKHSLADATAEMLTRGAEGLDKFELARVAKEMGVVEGITLHTENFGVSFGATVIAGDLEQFLRTAFTVLHRPLFPEVELAQLKQEWSARLSEERNNTGPVASNRLQSVLYPSGHPFHSKEFDEQLADLQSLTVQDLRDFHTSYYTANGAVLCIVGDVSEERAIGIASTVFGDSPKRDYPPIIIPAVAIPPKSSRIEAFLPDKSSMDILMGHPVPVRRTDKEYYALQLASLALGGDTITSRLGKLLREQHGLTYGIYARVGDSTHGMATWLINLTVNPVNAEKSLALVDEVLHRYKSKGIVTEELRREATGAAGLFKVSLRSSSALARVLTRFETLGLGPEGVDEHPDRVLAVKKAEVDAVIEKYLHPDHMITVLAGTLVPTPAGRR
ncbi:MAG: insulinase family protein [Candidatus Obscuribacterales bacterium]|nr:insulinase family protein [Candidatus Obscuribacterales bacterium]